MNGTVAFFHDRKRYGFIESDEAEDDIFFHADDLDIDDVEEGTELEFEVEEGDRGPRATDIEVLE